MAAQAVGLRIDMTETMKVAERAFNPEGAIKMAAELQRLGVQQSALLDPLQLMNLSENDPAELQNQIAEMSKQFVHLNEKGQFEILPGAKRQMREIEKSLGLSTGTLAKMALSSAELDEKMSKIKFPEIATEEQKKLLANISEMKDGKVMIDVGGKKVELAEALQGKNKEQIDALIESTKPKSVEELAKGQLNALEEIKVGINLMSGKLPAALAGTKGGEDIVRGLAESQSKFLIKANETAFGTTSQLSKNLGLVIDDVGSELRKLLTSKDGNLTEFTKVLGEAVKKLQTVVAEKMPNMEQGKEMIGKLGGNIDLGSILTELSEDLTKFGNVIRGQDIIISEQGVVQTAPQDTIIAATGLDKIFEMTKTPNPISNVKLDENRELSKISEKITTEKVETKPIITEQTVNLKISIDAPPQVDTNMIERMLKDRGVTEAIIKNISNVKSNSNLTPQYG